MEIPDCEKEIQELRKANRILKKKLERSESDRLKLEETNKKKEYLLKNVIEELEASQSKLKERSSELETTLINLQTTQDKMSALGSLIADVAHEINNPIGFISGNLLPAQEYVHDLLSLIDVYQKCYPQPYPEIEEIINEIDLEYVREDLLKLIFSMKEGTNRIRSISNSLRTFCRADIEQKVSFNIHEGIENTLLILKHRLKANQYRPAIQILQEYGELPLVKCFPGQINQVLMNLLANAIDALDESNDGRSFYDINANPNKIKIQTALDRDKNHAVIHIQDNGVGMSEYIQEKVFDHLFTTKAVGKGTGLGLSIARKIIVEKHGGTLKLNSLLGQGTEFIVSIPMY